MAGHSGQSGVARDDNKPIPRFLTCKPPGQRGSEERDSAISKFFKQNQ